LDPIIKNAIEQAVKTEPFATMLKMELMELEDGHSRVEMTYVPDKMDNIYSRAHGGAVFSLIDEAFETASQTDGTIAVALKCECDVCGQSESGRPIERLRRQDQSNKKNILLRYRRHRPE